MAFGQNVTFRTPQPTKLVDEIKAALAGIENDTSGIERVFSATAQAVEQYERYARGSNRWNVMLVIFTDEAGDDAEQMLDQAVEAGKGRG